MKKVLVKTMMISAFVALPICLISCDSGGGESGSNSSDSNELNVGDEVTVTLQDNPGTINLNVLSANSLTYNYDVGDEIVINGNIPFTFDHEDSPSISSIINADLNQTVGILNSELSEEGSLVASFYADNDSGNGASNWDESLRWQFVGVVNTSNPDSHLVLLDSRFYLLTEASIIGEGSSSLMYIKGVRVSPFRTAQGVFSFLLFSDQTVDIDYVAEVTYSN